MIKILAAYYERNISEYKIAKNAGKWQSIVNIAAHPEKKMCIIGPNMSMRKSGAISGRLANRNN